MTGPQTQQEAINAFINLANELKNDGASIQFVSTALMRACAVYATYVVAGTDGALKESGIEKLSEVFSGTETCPQVMTRMKRALSQERSTLLLVYLSYVIL